ncbi:MAG: hypothetical protein P4N41_16725 [Negativicutes bacterium]|nr:hypothetical protein [Negativicutes bacterium]MDR3591300.1 hypothetical protein [Negativicutes bacterium]
MEFFVLFLFVGLPLWAVGCYLNYCVVRKFDPATTFLQNLIPVYNYYLLARLALAQPVRYLILTAAAVILAVGLGFSSQWCNFVFTLMLARIWGGLAEKLGKSFWKYAVFSVIPGVNLITIAVLAFDPSRPTGPAAPIAPPEPAIPPGPPTL